MRKDIIIRLFRLCICLLILIAITLRKDGRLLGHSVGAGNGIEALDTVRLSISGDSIIVNTTVLSENVLGYAGPTPIKLYILDNKIDSIAVLKNSETPGFLRRASSRLFPLYIGKSVSEARTMQVDAVSGCTFTSTALIKNIDIALEQLPDDSSVMLHGHRNWRDILKLTLAVLAALSAAIVPLFCKNKTYRFVQMVLNTAILGFYSASFISYSSMVGALANGLTFANTALAILIVTAFIYPLFGKRAHYCTWACPYGSAQELMGHCGKKKIHIGAKAAKWLELGQQILWVILVVLAMSGAFLDWMDYEPFSAFMWQSAEWIVIAFAVLMLVLSIFINRPYCRFVCPTGAMLKKL